MPYRLAVAAWIALATLVPPAAAQDAPEAAACRDLTNSLDAEPATATAFCDAIAVLAERAEAAEARAAAIESRLGEVAPWVAPPGAILLVDDVRGCPDGWTDVAIDEPEVFAGRFPVAISAAPCSCSSGPATCRHTPTTCRCASPACRAWTRVGPAPVWSPARRATSSRCPPAPVASAPAPPAPAPVPPSRIARPSSASSGAGGIDVGRQSPAAIS
jgi:hypothetical protein